MATTVNDFLVEQAPQIGTDINQKMMDQPTPWITLYKQEMWEDEKSNVQKTFQFDRAILTDSGGTAAEEVEWADMSTASTLQSFGGHQQASDATGGVPPADYVKYSETIREYNLQHKALWGPPMNTNNLRDKFVRVQQMNACVKAMADQTRQFWIERKRSEYTRVSDNLVVLDSNFSLNGGDYDNVAMPAYSGTDGSILTNGFLDEIYEYENFNGANQGALGMTENRPVYGLITSARQSRRLIMADPDTREDFRYSNQNEKLLGPMGLKWTYNGYSHICDDSLPRWEYVPASAVTIAVAAATAGIAVATFSAGLVDSNGATVTLKKGSTIIVTGTDACKLIVTGAHADANKYYVKSADGEALVVVDPAVTTFTAWARVPQFVYDSGTAKVIPNPAWLAATWEDSFIFHQDVCCSKVPRPITSVGKASFDAINYAGEIKWTNYDDKANNPDKTIGQFRCVLANGTKPLNPEFGIVLRHLAVPRPDGRVNPGDSLGL
jgi:hypothetical protein